MSARTMSIKARTKACKLNKRDKVQCEPNPIGRDGNRGASLEITAEDRRREPHKFLYKSTKLRHDELARRIDRKKNIQEPITIKDFVTFQDSSWRTLQQKLQQGVPAKSATHTPGTIGGELVFYISKGIITQNRTTAGVSKSLGDSQLGCQTYDYNNVTNRVLNTVASIQDDAQWNRLFSLSSQGVLNTNRMNMSKDSCINIDQGSLEDGTIIKAATTAFAPIGSSTCIPPYDPCRTSGSCFIAGWVADQPDTSVIPIARPFTLIEKVTQCCPGVACENAVPGGLEAPDADNKYFWPHTDEDNPMITHINGVQCYQFLENNADGEYRSTTEQPNGWCWYDTNRNKWRFRLPKAVPEIGNTIVNAGDLYKTDILTGARDGNCGGEGEGDGFEDPEITVYLRFGAYPHRALTFQDQQVNTAFTVGGVTAAVGDTVTILFKVSDTEISIQKDSGEILNPVDGKYVNNSGVPEE